MNSPAPNLRLSLAVQYASETSHRLPSRNQLRRWVRAALDPSHAAEVTLRLVDAEEGRQLNHTYRGRGTDRDYATNVLSFPYSTPPHVAGDLVLCVPVVLREARAQHKTASAHFAHLVVHGMLHLQGYDHEDDASALRMETRERDILRRFRIADPYATITRRPLAPDGAQ